MNRSVINITFHGVGDPKAAPAGEERVWVTKALLCSILDAAAARPDVRITFDDGNVSDFLIAYPELKQRGLKATFFVVAGRLDKAGYLESEQVRELIRGGMTIGIHGMEHRPWRGLSDQELREEIIESRDRIERVAGVQTPWASCPFGEYDRRVLDALRQAGYERVFTSDRGPAQSDDWLQRRNTVWDSTSVEAEVKRIFGGAWEPGVVRTVKQLVKRWR